MRRLKLSSPLLYIDFSRKVSFGGDAEGNSVISVRAVLPSQHAMTCVSGEVFVRALLTQPPQLSLCWVVSPGLRNTADCRGGGDEQRCTGMLVPHRFWNQIFLMMTIELKGFTAVTSSSFSCLCMCCFLYPHMYLHTCAWVDGELQELAHAQNGFRQSTYLKSLCHFWS